MSRLSINIPEQTKTQLADLRLANGMCMSYNVRSAISVYYFLMTEKNTAGARVLLEYPDKPSVEVLFL